MKFVKIVSIEASGKNHVYDIAMAKDEDPSFIANGIIVHNTYASQEAGYSLFLETTNSYRTDLTERIFNSKLFPLIAVVNNLYKDPSKGRAKGGQLLDFLFNRNNRNNLKMPQLHWHKELEAKGEDNMAELLELASDKGVPIPLKMWMAASKIDPESLLRDLSEDQALRDKLAQYTGKDTSHEGEDDHEFSDEDDNAHDGRGVDVRGSVPGERLTTQRLSQMIQSPRVPLLAREFGDSGDSWTFTKTGKVKHVPSIAKADRNAKANDTILKIAKQADRDPHYREELKKRNQAKLGRTKVKDM